MISSESDMFFLLEHIFASESKKTHISMGTVAENQYKVLKSDLTEITNTRIKENLNS